MSALRQPRMTVDEFLSWADGRDGRFELVAGEVVAMAPERARHAETKFAVQTALARAIADAGLACHMLPDGMTVRIDKHSAYEPDALVYCGKRLPSDAVVVEEPLLVVEVLSPGTGALDTGAKLADYFKVATIQHYLIVDPVRRVVIHHRRSVDAAIETRIAAAGELRLEPPGMVVPTVAFFAEP